MFMKKITIFFSIFFCLLVTGCGSSSSSSSSSSTSVILQVVPGPWSGTYSLGSSGQIAVTGAVASGGFGYFADNQGNVFLIENVPQQSPFSSTVVGTAPPGQTFTDGNSNDVFSASGTYSSTATATNLQATLTGIDPTTAAATGLNGNFTLKTEAPYAGTPSIAALQGQLSGYYTGKSSTSVVLTINADGTFSGNDGYGCSITGSFVQQNPGTNLFFVNYKTSGGGCPGIMNGLAYVSSKDVSGAFGGATGTYLYMGIFGPSVAYAAELKL